jgi:hypothetical protein
VEFSPIKNFNVQHACQPCVFALVARVWSGSVPLPLNTFCSTNVVKVSSFLKIHFRHVLYFGMTCLIAVSKKYRHRNSSVTVTKRRTTYQFVLNRSSTKPKTADAPSCCVQKTLSPEPFESVASLEKERRRQLRVYLVESNFNARENCLVNADLFLAKRRNYR